MTLNLKSRLNSIGTYFVKLWYSVLMLFKQEEPLNVEPPTPEVPHQKRAYKRVTEEDLETLRSLAGTVSVNEIAVRMERSVQSVQSIAHCNGISLRVPRIKQYEAEQIERLLKEGSSYQEINDELPYVSYTTIRNYAIQNHLNTLH